ncbi:MAG: TolC family protein, partial [Treponema sp.]|nr:TolC family protein [Treponema sp.]
MRRAFVFFILILCMGAFSQAQHASAPQVTLSLDDALRLGVENSLSLQRSLLDLSSAEYSANRLWAEVFPSISANIGASYGSRPLFSGSGSGSVGTSASLG